MKIAIYAFDGITSFHLAAPLLVFTEVSRLGLADDWRTIVWSDSSQAIRTAEGLLIDDLRGPSEAADADLLVIPSWPTELPAPETGITALIQRSHASGTVIAGLCLGAFPVAHTGVLNNRAAVTHWAAAAELAARSPGVDVQTSALYIDHGDVLTSAGTASSLDACLHIVRSRLGSRAAATVARHIVIAPHREGDQAQYIERPLPDQEGSGAISETMVWALSNLDKPLTIDVLATQAHMSTRSFNRHFREATGTTPAKWVLVHRLDEARLLLETTSWSISRIAAACGFASVVTFRQTFAKAYSTTPTSYRQRFTAQHPYGS